MAFLGIVVLLTAIGAAVHGDEVEKFKDVLNEVEKKCNETIKVPESVLKQFKNMGHLDDSKEGKCYIHCVLEALQMFDKDGKINRERSEEIVHMFFKKEEDITKAIKVGKACATKAVQETTDNCERAYYFIECVMDGYEKEDLEKPFKD